jgi:hypothetical protein
MVESVSEDIYKTLFRPGARVECVNADFPPSTRCALPELPVVGSTYTVEKFEYIASRDGQPPSPCVRLAEFQLKPHDHKLALPFWGLHRFRLVVTEENREILEAWEKIYKIYPGLGDLVEYDKADPRVVSDLISAFLTLDGWEELAGTNIMLALLIAHCSEFDGLGKERASERKQAYLRMKRANVCGCLGFAENESTVRLLAKTKVGPLEERGLLYTRVLRMLTRHDPMAVRLLGRLSLISFWELAAVGFGFDMFEMEKMVSASEVDGMGWFFSRPLQERVLVMDAWKQAAFYESQTIKTLAPPLRRVASFNKCSTALSWLTEHRKVRRAIYFAERRVCRKLGSTIGWPDPPIPSADGIEPITSAEALVTEGNTMKHCSASHVDKVVSGESFFYRLTLSPQRYTLSVEFKDEEWKLGDVRAFENKPCMDPEVRAVIDRWLHTHDRSRPGNQRMDFLRAVAAEAKINARNVQIKANGGKQNKTVSAAPCFR